jgi:excinuclease ABC subunit B
LQIAYNAAHGITPEGITKAIRRGIEEEIQAKAEARKAIGRDEATDATEEYLNALEAEMLKAADELQFERAAALRDRILELKSAKDGGEPRPSPSPQATSARAKAKAKARGGKRGERRSKPQ